MRATAAANAALPLLVCLLPGIADADCPQSYNAIREEAYRNYQVEMTCDDALSAARLLPIRPRATAHETIAFAGEEDLRRELRDAHGIRVPRDILLLGLIERQPPAGPRIIVAFGLDMPRRLAAFMSLARLQDAPERRRLAPVLGNGAWYDRVGFYFEGSDGKMPVDGVWRPMRNGGLWGEHQPIPQNGVRVCLRCSGWLCPNKPVACFSDLNADGAEEVHLTDDCRGGKCELAVLEPRPNAVVRMILNQNVRQARWKDTPEGWVLLREPLCRQGRFRCGGRENPNCERPKLYVVRRDGGSAVRSERAEQRLFPVRRRRWPRGCPARKGDVELVYSPERGFILYEK